MTLLPPVHVARPAAPDSITLTRVLLVVQAALGLCTSATLGFLAVLGLAWTTSDGSGPSALAFVVTALFVACLGVTIATACLAGALRQGARRARTALLVIEPVVGAGLIVVLVADEWSGGLVVAPMLYLGCAVATIAALLRPPARIWCNLA